MSALLHAVALNTAGLPSIAALSEAARIDTFVTAQLRPVLTLATPTVRAFHLRDANGQREIDLVLESASGVIVAIEIKAAGTATARDARHLAWLRDELGPAFKRGIVLHAGNMTFPLGDKLCAVPIASLWRP